MRSPEALAAGVTALAIALAEGRDTDELDTMGAAFSQLGDTLCLIAGQREKLAECEKKYQKK